MENDRRKFINIGGKVLQIVDVFRYARKNGLKIKDVDVSRFYDCDVLPHFSKYAQIIDNTVFFKEFTFKRFIDEMKNIENAENNDEFPIIVTDDKEILDGSHRLLRAIYENEEKIKTLILSKKDMEKLTKEFGK